MNNYFFSIAMAARARGFAITPLRDKRPFVLAWNKHPLMTETEIRTAAKEYPTCDVGVVLKRRVGEPFAIDIDVPGVIERMEHETGRALPATYTVLTKPETAPHKRHVLRSTHAQSLGRMSSPVSTTSLVSVLVVFKLSAKAASDPRARSPNRERPAYR
jgi:Bifunctional DNA primase/polymerase, N-terminal